MRVPIHILVIVISLTMLNLGICESDVNNTLGGEPLDASNINQSNEKPSSSQERSESRQRRATLPKKFLFPIKLEMSYGRYEELIDFSDPVPHVRFLDKKVADFPFKDGKPVVRVWAGEKGRSDKFKYLTEETLVMEPGETDVRLRVTADEKSGFAVVQIKKGAYHPMSSVNPEKILFLAQTVFKTPKKRRMDDL